MRVVRVEDYIEQSWLERDAALVDTPAPSDLIARFPFLVIVEASYFELDVVGRWCWQSFGARDGECNWQTAYPACPLVLGAEKAVVRIDQHGFEYIGFVDPVKREHTGSWTTHWLGKTDYDYGFGTFCFDNKIRFIEHVPKVDFGEKYT